MFNLIVRSVPWNTGNETMPVERVFEYTDDHVAAQFKENGILVLDRLIRLPCLFMQEGIGDELAYVGSVIRARIANREVAFEYTLDADIPPLQNSMIYANRNPLRQARRELPRHGDARLNAPVAAGL